jgi:hypothetical protein
MLSENRAVYETMWKNIVEPGRPQMTIWRMRIACWIPKAYKHTLRICNTYYFPLQQLLRESASLLRYTYIACLVINCVIYGTQLVHLLILRSYSL